MQKMNTRERLQVIEFFIVIIVFVRDYFLLLGIKKRVAVRLYGVHERIGI